MIDRLEEFVKSHRTEFDLQEPDPKLWKGIERSISLRRKYRWSYYLSRAAVVIFLIGATLVGQKIWMKYSPGKSETTADVEINIPELKEAEMYYSGMINEKLKEVKPLLLEYPTMEKELETDLSELDSIYSSLKNDLKDNIANHEVIEAMIQNYRLRISILEDMLNFLESQKKEKKTHNTEQI
jgi:hypothetical protein